MWRGGPGYAAGPARLAEQRLSHGDASLGEAGLGEAEIQAPEALEALLAAQIGEAIGVNLDVLAPAEFAAVPTAARCAPR